MYKHILVPVDGSAPAYKALDLAADLAKLYGATVHLMHVAPTQEIPEGLRKWAKTEHVSESPSWLLDTGLAQKLLSEAKDILAKHGISASNELIEHGDVAKAIISAVEAAPMDMVVMGTRGFSDLKGLVMGSVAHKVSHAAPCTVVTVR